MTTRGKLTKHAKHAAAEAARAVQQEGAADLAALRTHPEFRAAIEAARASFARGEEFSGEELDEHLAITDQDKAAGEAWLEEYERELAREKPAT